MNLQQVSAYNRDQWNSFLAILKGCETLPSDRIEELRGTFQSYLQFRRELDAFQTQYFEPICRPDCFETKLSACCGFESIFTFFADQVITFLLSTPEEMCSIFEILQQPNKTGRCVYLGEQGCRWKVRPISCAMFLCDQAKKRVFETFPESEVQWKEFQRREKEYTWPTQPVLFDDVEKYFLKLKVDSPHMYFHKSPGLLRLKTKSGLCG